MESKTSMAPLDSFQTMKNKTLYSVPGRSAARLAADWIRGGDLPDWPQFARGVAILTYQCRDAIALACRLLGLEEGNEVLVPAYNCGTEIDPILQENVRVRLYRVDERARIDARDMACRVTEKTRAILVTHYFGWGQDLEPIIDLCRERGLYLIEDCAHALFSASAGGWLGRHGDIAVYSLAKSLPVPHGGVAVLRNTEGATDVHLRRSSPIQTLRDCLALLRRHTLRTIGNTRLGSAAILRWRRRREDVDAVGDATADRPDMPDEYYFKQDMATTKASRMVCGAMASTDVDQVIARRRRNYLRLFESISDLTSIEPLFDSLPDGTCPLHLPILVSRRDRWVRELTSCGVYSLPWWAGYHRDLNWMGFEEAMVLKDRVLTLPVDQGLTDETVDLIAETVRTVAQKIGQRKVQMRFASGTSETRHDRDQETVPARPAQ